MQLTEQAIKEYQRIYLEEFGKEISREKAFEQGTKLVLLVETITKYAERTK